jgi:hypothetical protein
MDGWQGAHEVRKMLKQDPAAFAEHSALQNILDNFYRYVVAIYIIHTCVYICI